MKFPTIPRHFPLKTFGEVFNRLLNAYCLKMKMLRRCFAGGDAMVFVLSLEFGCCLFRNCLFSCGRL